MTALHGRFNSADSKPLHLFPLFGPRLFAWHDLVVAAHRPDHSGVWFPFPAGTDCHEDPWPLVFGGRPLVAYRDRYEYVYTVAGHVPEGDAT